MLNKAQFSLIGPIAFYTCSLILGRRYRIVDNLGVSEPSCVAIPGKMLWLRLLHIGHLATLGIHRSHRGDVVCHGARSEPQVPAVHTSQICGNHL